MADNRIMIQRLADSLRSLEATASVMNSAALAMFEVGRTDEKIYALMWQLEELRILVNHAARRVKALRKDALS